VRNRFPPPTSVKQPEDVLQEEWYKTPLETVQEMYEAIPRRTAVLFKAKVPQHHINKEMCTVYVVFPLFCPAPLHIPSFSSTYIGYIFFQVTLTLIMP
jgi:hypothetical protein